MVVNSLVGFCTKERVRLSATGQNALEHSREQISLNILDQIIIS